MNNTSKSAKIDLYKLLNVEKNATKDEIVNKNLNQKKAYKILALRTHPDKNPNDEKAAENFSSLNKAYNVLMDDEKRNLYNTTGLTDDDDAIDIDNTYNYFKDIYPKISQNDIDDFTLKYKGSNMEIEDLMIFYNENNGDLTELLEWIPLSENDDIDKFILIYEDLFKKKVLKKNKNYTITKKKIKKLKTDNQEEVEDEKKKFEDLCQQIVKKNNKNTNYFVSLSR